MITKSIQSEDAGNQREQKEQMNIAEAVYHAALDCGYDNCGIISPETLAESEARLRQRMEAVPSGANFYKGIESLFRPVKDRFPWVKSVIVLTAEHGKYRYPDQLRKRYAKAFFLSPEEGQSDGWDHVKFESWLTEQGIRWTPGGVPLRDAAVRAGLGIVRKNNFFYTDNGSFVGLTAYLIDRECTLIQHVSPKPCSEACTLCQKACRSGALSAAYTMDPMKCISFWTTFGKGNVPPYLKESMFEEWICGCDNCQDACPYNRAHNWDEGEPFSNLEEIAPKLAPECLLDQTDDFLRTQVIAKTADHLAPEDTQVLRTAAKRAVSNRSEK